MRIWIIAASLVTGAAIALACNLALLFSPSSPSVACAAAPGSFVSAVVIGGGDATPVTLTFSAPSPDFAISGSNIVVGPSGIAPGDCGKAITITVLGTQN